METVAMKEYLNELKDSLLSQPWGAFLHPAIVVRRGNCYPGQLWDWVNWANNIAVRQIATEQGTEGELFEYEKGSPPRNRPREW